MKTFKLVFAAILMAGLFISFISPLSAQEEMASDKTHFGEKISKKGAMDFEDFYAKMKDQKEMEVKIRGEVTGVCQKKGCWMTMNEGDKELFIKFKDYAFFVPMDISGREAIIEGKAYREVVSVDELRHMAEDAGKSEEEIAKITEPQEELRFMANGVILLPSQN